MKYLAALILIILLFTFQNKYLAIDTKNMKRKWRIDERGRKIRLETLAYTLNYSFRAIALWLIFKWIGLYQPDKHVVAQTVYYNPEILYIPIFIIIYVLSYIKVNRKYS
ncbi:hypothetical protein [Staphylococcus massiliensis]|uniref:Uncharacterized protein n=1 Tax=Staphylococcus massiliensis S46 TaxID=1229783 RepID=K9AIF8_9STAP|nr:hypothetical protein [Staphylococcus massiliensis]EKU47074.1 hypothetical protein C273_08206 [Staphylococcus massiliensis S46]MCG3412333.1 hypothetical protein [Staphylococcus massiliensis]PNZ98511.1 hypothetical protein CD133_08390 [Staphylococcus massiliensis CCUG 55927]